MTASRHALERPLWTPSRERTASANMTLFMRHVSDRHGATAHDYEALYDWSIRDLERFWHAVWSFCGVMAATQGDTVCENAGQMPGARWFTGARLNFAENLLRRRDRATALVFWGEDRVKSRLPYSELYAETSRFAQALAAAGVVPGDRVAGYLPNVPEDYVHRIGRTGRAGASGQAISLLSSDERGLMRDIERLIRKQLPRERVPGYEPDPNARNEPEPDDRPPRRTRSGRKRGRGGHRRRPGGRFQNRVAQSSVVHRALPGRRYWRRRHHSRHLHHGSAADRALELTAVWAARGSPGTADIRRCGCRYRRIWQ